MGGFVCKNCFLLSALLSRMWEDLLIFWVRWSLYWLDSWPAGLKFNTELSRFYSHSFSSIVTVWQEFLHRSIAYFPLIIFAVGFCSCGGVSLAISLILDMLAISTFHIFICYIVSRAVYHKFLRMFRSLWNLFRGKRYNVLRDRTDSWEYDLDQLLFGTILFTLLAFLFPTVLVYYALFAMMRLGILMLHASLETLLALINHFPLFVLMLRVKDPCRLPGGIYFFRTKFQEPTNIYAPLEIKNQPVPLSSIFFQYTRLLLRFASHYNPLRLFHCIFSGDYLAAIPRYSMRYDKISNRRR